jgi:cytochrome c oxidase subunit 2
MRGLKILAMAAALALVGGAQAQEATPSALAPAGMAAAEAVPTVAAPAADAATAAAPVAETVPGPVANAGTRPTAGIGQPVDRGIHIQPQVTALGQRASDFNTALLIIMGAISGLVFLLLIWSMIRFNRRANPVPSKNAHNTLIEIVWTLGPVLVLIGIAIPSFKLLAAQYDPPKSDLTIKATGHQWYWSYEYPDHGGFGFDAVMLSDADAKAVGEPRNLATDNRIVVPVGKTVKVLVTAADVLHSWAVPAFWVKMDAVPGRINETWFKAEREGLYYGQCSELCGTKHAFMPIAVEVVSDAKFAAWVAARKADAGIEDAAAPAAAAAALPAPAAAPAAPAADTTTL